MKEERPITREAARALMGEIHEAIASGRDRAVVGLAGAELELEKDAEGRITLRAAGQQQGMRLFVASSHRPADYPEGIPFVPDEIVTVGSSEQMVIWWAPGDPEAVLRHLGQRCDDEGWSLEASVGTAPTVRATYGRAGVQRFLMLSVGMVTLIQRPARGPGRPPPTED